MNQSYLKIYNNLINLTTNKKLYSKLDKQDTFSDRLTLFLFHFAFLLKNLKSNENSKTLQELYDFSFRQIELSIREIGYGDQSINKKMKDYINLFHSIVSDVHFWKEDSNIENLIDIISEGDLNCYQDFDIASERGEFIGDVYISNEVVFTNRILSDFLQSIGNRVLEIDDISDQFNSNARTTPFEVIARYDSNYCYNKIFTHVRDRTFTDERQFAVVSVLQDNSIGYISQYASIESYPYLGYFDYARTGTGWNLLFFPVKFETNVYDISSSAINILSDLSDTGLDAYGDVAYTVGGYQAIPASTKTTIVSFGTTYRAAKIIALFDGVSDQMYGVELNIVHDGTDCYQMETNALNEVQGLTGVGFGTFDSTISGSNVIVEFTPDASIGFAMTCTTGTILISDSNTSTGNEFLNVTKVCSSYSTIAASGSPSANIVASYDSPSESAYYLFSVEDTTNNRYEFTDWERVQKFSSLLS